MTNSYQAHPVVDALRQDCCMFEREVPSRHEWLGVSDQRCNRVWLDTPSVSLAVRRLDMSDTIEHVIIEEDRGDRPGAVAPEVAEPAEQIPALDRDGQQRLAEQLVAQARAQGLDLAGADGLLAQLTKRVLETALDLTCDTLVRPWFGVDALQDVA